MIRMQKPVLNLLLLAVTLIYLIPGWIVLVSSMKSELEANKLSISLPSQFHFENFRIVFKEAHVLQSLFNGVFVGGISVMVIIVLSSMAAFSIARITSRTTTFAYYLFISGLVVPGAAIPTYLILSILHLINTYSGLILTFVSGAFPFSVFLYTGFMKGVPRELDESAIIDGCGKFMLFFRIVFPLLRPVTVTVLIFNFLGIWNDVGTYLYFASEKKWAMPLTVYNFLGKFSSSWNLIFADIVITVFPVILLYFFAQKFIIAGMTSGAVKG